MNYISLIEELKKRGSIPGLDAIQGLLEELGHPEDDLKIVHIAGTNGKGSVFAYLSSILMAAGFKVGRYISPTISCYEERFQILSCFGFRLNHNTIHLTETVEVRSIQTTEISLHGS